jgi:glycosyltransferase involved in cell wall biosynthesis
MPGDVLISLAFETYADTVRRASFSPDLLVEQAMASAGPAKVVVADAWRSYLSAVKQRVSGEPVRFPAAPNRVHLAPHRWRRSDPVSYPAALAQSRRYLARLRAAVDAPRTSLVVTHPLPAAAADPGQWRRVTYYGWDDWAAHPRMAESWPAFEQAYADIAAHGLQVAAVTPRIVERVAPTGAALVLPNGIREDDWIHPVTAPQWYLDMPRPRLLYTGTVDGRLSAPHVSAVARAFPTGSVLVVGTIDRPGVQAEFADLPNVTVRNWEPRDVVRGLIFHCDAGLIPHVDSPLTRAMSPLKMYEYLAAGRPVVATDLPAVREVHNVLVAGDIDGFIGAVRRALENGPAAEPARLEFIRANGWARRMTTLLEFAAPD